MAADAPLDPPTIRTLQERIRALLPVPGASGLDPALGGLLKELSQCGNRVRQLLAADPQPELMVVLDVLEPVGERPVDGLH